MQGLPGKEFLGYKSPIISNDLAKRPIIKIAYSLASRKANEDRLAVTHNGLRLAWGFDPKGCALSENASQPNRDPSSKQNPSTGCQ